MLTCPRDSGACNKADHSGEDCLGEQRSIGYGDHQAESGKGGLDVSFTGVLTSSLLFPITSSSVIHLLKCVLPSKASTTSTSVTN